VKAAPQGDPFLSSCSALILGAGRSSRLGGLKPLLPLGGQTIIERVIRLFQGVGIGQIVVVLGHEAELIRSRIEPFGVDPVINTRCAEGMFSSVQAGVDRLDRSCRAFFILPADIPFVRPETLRNLLEVFGKGDADLCRPSYRGRFGHPPLISVALVSAIRDFGGTGGLRALLARYGDRTKDVPVEDPGIMTDIDTCDDYQAALKAVSRDPLWPSL
jgi:molybdenum cofactor cytidylyltransferase